MWYRPDHPSLLASRRGRVRATGSQLWCQIMPLSFPSTLVIILHQQHQRRQQTRPSFGENLLRVKHCTKF